MPTRSGKAFSPTPDSQPAVQINRPNRCGSVLQHGCTTRASKKRILADSDASLMELESEPKAAGTRPGKRQRERVAREIKPLDSDALEVNDSTRDEDSDLDRVGQQKSRPRATEAVQEQHAVKLEATNRQHGPPLQHKQAAPAVLPDDVEVQPLWQVDLVGECPHSSTLTQFIDEESTPEGLRDDTPADIVHTEVPSIQRQKATPLPPARVMFTYLQAKHLVYGAGRNSALQTVPPFTLSAGENMPHPVTRSYHLGAVGRYTKNDAQNLLSSSTDHPGEYIFDWGAHHGSRIEDVPRAYIASLLSSPNLNKILNRRQGLLEALKSRIPNDSRLAGPLPSGNARTLPVRTSGQAPERPTQVTSSRHRYQFSTSSRDQRSVVPIEKFESSSANSQLQTAEHGQYILTFGPFRGKAITKAPIAWLRSLEKNQQVFNAHPTLREGFERHFPRGIFQYEVENYRLSDGPYELHRLNEVPESYIQGLQQDYAKVGESVVLQRALKLRNRELGWSNVVLDASIRRYHQEKRQPNSSTKSTGY
ncbi:hypothetical protein DE146DRAFT_218002 [Phaeosphaeria sp. MPI-PUGE-AT-0046c]|nr:hypothetical protein DE146DRAFT_218002 [Phaeosphaeria sp. MPI-PUGE-AT-0046c]